jgi:hypothetical protein
LRSAILLALSAMVLAGCATSGRQPSHRVPPADSFTLPSGNKDGVSPASSSRTTVTGILAFDDVEGGCSFVETSAGHRYEVVYPAGWSIDRVAAELRGPDGERFPAGSTVALVGSIARDRASTCQIGPIFVASKVDAARP